MVLTLPLV
jgi:hypothetical protein